MAETIVGLQRTGENLASALPALSASSLPVTLEATVEDAVIIGVNGPESCATPWKRATQPRTSTHHTMQMISKCVLYYYANKWGYLLQQSPWPDSHSLRG